MEKSKLNQIIREELLKNVNWNAASKPTVADLISELEKFEPTDIVTVQVENTIHGITSITNLGVKEATIQITGW